MVERELALHDPRLAALPRMLALSKSDLVAAEAAERSRVEWEQRLGEEVPVVLTSSATRNGLEELAVLLVRTVPALELGAAPTAESAAEEVSGLAEHRLFRPAPPRPSRCAAVPMVDSASRAKESSGSSPAMTWITRTRWRTSSDG